MIVVHPETVRSVRAAHHDIRVQRVDALIGGPLILGERLWRAHQEEHHVVQNRPQQGMRELEKLGELLFRGENGDAVVLEEEVRDLAFFVLGIHENAWPAHAQDAETLAPQFGQRRERVVLGGSYLAGGKNSTRFRSTDVA